MTSEAPDGARAHVEPGGAALLLHVPLPEGGAVEVRKLSVGPMDNNVYVVVDAATRDALLIDAANDAERLLEELRGLRVRTVLTTHGHGDHWQALAAVREATGARVLHHEADAGMIPVPADEHVRDGDVLEVGGATLELLHTPGHTPGSTCALLAGTHLFTGDTLFPGGPGATFGDADAFARLMRSLDERVFVLDDATQVLPGHGDGTTLGRERPHVEEWRARGW